MQLLRNNIWSKIHWRWRNFDGGPHVWVVRNDEDDITLTVLTTDLSAATVSLDYEVKQSCHQHQLKSINCKNFECLIALLTDRQKSRHHAKHTDIIASMQYYFANKTTTWSHQYNTAAFCYRFLVQAILAAGHITETSCTNYKWTACWWFITVSIRRHACQPWSDWLGFLPQCVSQVVVFN